MALKMILLYWKSIFAVLENKKKNCRNFECCLALVPFNEVLEGRLLGAVIIGGVAFSSGVLIPIFPY